MKYIPSSVLSKHVVNERMNELINVYFLPIAGKT